MLHLLYIIMVTMPLMIIPSVGTNFRLTPLEGSIKKTKDRKIKSFEDVEKLFTSAGKTKTYPTFKEINDVYQAENVMSAVMYFVEQKEGRPFGMYLDPSKSKELEAFRQKLSKPFAATPNINSKKNPGRVAKGFQYVEGKKQVALFINIPKVIAAKTKFGKIEPGWIWMWVTHNDKINNVLGTKAFYKKGPWIFALKYTDFTPKKKKSAAHVDFVDNMGYYNGVYDDDVYDAYDEVYDDDDAYDAYDAYDTRMALNRLLNAYKLYEDLIEN